MNRFLDCNVILVIGCNNRRATAKLRQKTKKSPGPDMKSLVPYADSGGFSPACRVSHDFVLLFLMFSIFGGISPVRRFEPAVEPAEEYALPQDGVLGLDNPVVLVGEDYHFGRYAAKFGGIECHFTLR